MEPEAQAALATKIAANRDARKAAEALVDLINAELVSRPDHAQEIIRWAIFNSVAPYLTSSHAKDLPMTERGAWGFGCQSVPFGQFAGQRVDDVPLERLQWYADQHFVDDLRRYLRSRRIMAEVDLTKDE